MAGVALAFFLTWYFIQAVTYNFFSSGFVVVVYLLFAALTVSLITLAVGLFLNWPFAWWLAIVSHCILAILVLLVHGFIAYDQIQNWEQSGRLSPYGDPMVVTIVATSFIVLQTLAVIPLVILVRNRPDSRIASTNVSHEI